MGPGRYAPEYSANTSNKTNMPRWTLPKAAPREAVGKKFDKHQTYDTRSGFGSQCISKNKTTTKCHFGTSGRTHSNKLGTFKDMMQGGSSVKCYQPKWWTDQKKRKDQTEPLSLVLVDLAYSKLLLKFSLSVFPKDLQTCHHYYTYSNACYALTLSPIRLRIKIEKIN